MLIRIRYYLYVHPCAATYLYLYVHRQHKLLYLLSYCRRGAARLGRSLADYIAATTRTLIASCLPLMTLPAQYRVWLRPMMYCMTTPVRSEYRPTCTS